MLAASRSALWQEARFYRRDTETTEEKIGQQQNSAHRETGADCGTAGNFRSGAQRPGRPAHILLLHPQDGAEAPATGTDRVHGGDVDFGHG